jgi:hypothetical protein
MDPTQDIQEPEPSEPKDTLVATVHAIKALALSMMETGCGQMRDPPHGQKQRKPQASLAWLRSSIQLASMFQPRLLPS